MPRPRDIFATLSGGEKFTKLDLRQAYLQCPVDSEAKELLTLNTHKGLYTMNRLAFGISSSPSIWQRQMEQILSGIPFCHCILDDILVTGRNDDEHLHVLDQVFTHLSQNNLRLNKDKCSFLQDSLEYCGHVLTKYGVHEAPDKITAIVDAPRPTNTTQLRSFLGMVTFYHNHLPNISTVLYPLNQLLNKNSKWNWTNACEQSFQKTKEMIADNTCLTHFDPASPIVLSTDASPYGIGAVLAHRTADGDERPICFASRTLTKAEQNYSQLDREGLSIVWAVQKMSDYVYGRKFTIITDNRPISAILASDRATPPMVAARLQRWSSFLSSYDYDIEYRETWKHGNADCLSYLPLPTQETRNTVSAIDAFYVNQLDTLPVTADMIRKATRTDPESSQVYSFVESGWPKVIPPNLQPYFIRRNELSLSQGCIVWGTRVVIPTYYRQQLLDELHEGHLGMVRMKHVARSFIWWPGIDSNIESAARQCTQCCQTRNMPTTVTHQWERPPGPWQRIHADFIGPVCHSMFLIVVDAYSKWPEVIRMKNDTTSAATIEAFRKLFSTWGMPLQLHTDNGPQFRSAEFEHFLKLNGVKHTTSPVYHPASNGQAERFVSTFKRAMKTMSSDQCTLETKIARFLLTYRTSVNASTGETPSLLMLGRRIRTRLDLIKPMSKNYTVKPKQQLRSFSIGQPVYIRDYRAKTTKWIAGVVYEQLGSYTYNIEVNTPYGHSVWKRHVDQIISRQSGEESQNPSEMPSLVPEHVDIQPDDTQDDTLTVSLPAVIPPRPNTTTMAPETSNPRTASPNITAEQSQSQSSPRSSASRQDFDQALTSEDSDSRTVYSSRGRKIVPPRKLQDFVTK